MDIQLLQNADMTLSRCGRPQMPQGISCVPFPKSYLIQFYFPANPPQAGQTITKEITPPDKGLLAPAAWALRSIQCTQPASLLLQVQLPDGRFLFNNGISIAQFAGFGSNRFLFTHEQDFPIGSKLQVTLQDVDVPNQQSIAMVFEGAYKWYLKGGAPYLGKMDTGCAPRYIGSPNQNILAPAWMYGEVPSSPKGCDDGFEFTYSSDTQVMTQYGAATAQIQIDPTLDFAMRRMFFLTVWDAGITAATILVRARNGSGYALHDDYLNTTYVANAPMPHDWELAAGDQVFFDLQLVDYAGTGNVSVTCYMEGVKRGRK